MGLLESFKSTLFAELDRHITEFQVQARKEEIARECQSQILETQYLDN